MKLVSAMRGPVALSRFLADFQNAPHGTLLHCEVADFAGKLVVLVRMGDSERVALTVAETKRLAARLLTEALPFSPSFVEDLQDLGRTLLEVAGDAEALTPGRLH
jgi:hypothetical protein